MCIIISNKQSRVTKSKRYSNETLAHITGKPNL